MRVTAQALLYRIRLMLVGANEPHRQVLGSLVWCLAVERHHRRRHAWKLQEIGSPPLGFDLCHLDEVATARDNSFKPMPHDVQ